MADNVAVFEFLNGLNVNGHTEKKTVGSKDLTYLSWPWAWAEVKKRFPDAHYTIWKNENGLPYTVDPMTGYMVYTSVTIEGITHEMWLPVMDGANRAMKPTEYDYQVKNPNFKWAKWDETRGGYYDKYGNKQTEYQTKHCEAASMMDVNKAIMRCLVKNLAMFGLGLYIYAGEDLPETEAETVETVPVERVAPKAEVTASSNTKAPPTNPVKAYVANELTFMKSMFNISDTKEMMAKFADMRKALIAMGVIPDISADKQTMEEAQKMIQEIYNHFSPSGAMKDVRTA
jgi:hypothetical protein